MGSAVVTGGPSNLSSTIPAVAQDAANRFACEPALVEGAVILSFADYVHGAESVARLLRERGAVTGDRVAVWAPNSSAWAVVALGVHMGGCVLVPINTRFVPAEAASVLNASGARIVFVEDEFLGRQYGSEVTRLREEGKVHAALATVGLPRPESLIEWLDRLPHGGGRIHEVGPAHGATVLFTSGTTGRAKGVLLRHSALVDGYRTWSSLTGMRTGDRVLASNPFFHAFGLNVCLLSALIHGATVYPVPVFDATSVHRQIERDRITYYPAPPTVFDELAAEQRASPRDVSSLRVCVTGATVISPAVIRTIRDDLGFDHVFVPYGFTEATGLGTITRRDDDLRTVMTTAGRPLPGVTVEVRRPDGSRAAVGETGEIFVGGYAVMAGYLQPDGSIDAPQLHDGGIASGDLGHFDVNGNLVISGRAKDMIVTGGFNVFPAEIENVLREHPAIKDVCVVSVPDRRLGEVGCAVIVPAAPGAVDGTAIREWSRRQMANYKVPRHFVVVDDLPRNSTGKVSKLDVREALPAHLLGPQRVGGG